MEWQPIETAPKDGTPILLFVPGELEPDEDTPIAVGRWGKDFWDGSAWCMDAGDYWRATHWMPLPPPPGE